VDQLTRLQREGCDAGQGFFFAIPLEAGEARAFLTANLSGAFAQPVASNA